MSPEAVADLTDNADDLELEQVPEVVDDKPVGEEKPDEMKVALAELARTQKTILERTAPEQKVAELTPEQKAEFWGVFNPEQTDKEFYSKWFRLNPDATPEEKAEVKALFAAVHEGIVKQSIKGSRNYIDHALEQIKQEYGPIREFVEQARAEKTRDRFYSDYPILKDKKFETITTVVARQLAEKTFDDEKAYFKALAEGVAGAVKGIDPSFDLGKQQQPAGKAPKLPRTSVGGGGGAGKGTSGVKEAGDDSADIFADD